MSSQFSRLQVVPSRKRRRSLPSGSGLGKQDKDRQLSLFPAFYDTSNLRVDCEISAQHLFGIDRVIAVLNDWHNFNPSKFRWCLKTSGVSGKEVQNLCLSYNSATKATLSKLLLIIQSETRRRR
jgi:hypothetical protein